MNIMMCLMVVGRGGRVASNMYEIVRKLLMLQEI